MGCSKVLDSYGILANLAMQHNRLDIMPFVRVFKALCGIKKACFGAELDPEFESICDEFKNSLLDLNLIHRATITTKFHMLCFHVKQYCRMTGKTFRLIS